MSDRIVGSVLRKSGVIERKVGGAETRSRGDLPLAAFVGSRSTQTSASPSLYACIGLKLAEATMDFLSSILREPASGLQGLQ